MILRSERASALDGKEEILKINEIFVKNVPDQRQG